MDVSGVFILTSCRTLNCEGGVVDFYQAVTDLRHSVQSPALQKPDRPE